jgi:hypothetical protein
VTAQPELLVVGVAALDRQTPLLIDAGAVVGMNRVGPSGAELLFGGPSRVFHPLAAQVVAVAVGPARPHQVRQRLRERLIMTAAFHERALDPLTVGDVGGHAEHGVRPAGLVPQRALHREIGAIAVGERHHLLLGQRRVGLHDAAVHRHEPLGDRRAEQIDVGASENLFRRDLEELEEALVHEEILAREILHVGDGRRAVAHRLQQAAASLQRAMGFAFFRLVSKDEHDAVDFTGRVPHRRRAVGNRAHPALLVAQHRAAGEHDGSALAQHLRHRAFDRARGVLVHDREDVVEPAVEHFVQRPAREPLGHRVHEADVSMPIGDDDGIPDARKRRAPFECRPALGHLRFPHRTAEVGDSD